MFKKPHEPLPIFINTLNMACISEQTAIYVSFKSSFR